MKRLNIVFSVFALLGLTLLLNCSANKDATSPEKGVYYKTRSTLVVFFALHDIDKCTVTGNSVSCTPMDIKITN